MNPLNHPRPANRRLPVLVACVALGGLAGCISTPASFVALDSTKFTLANTDRFVPMDREVRQAVTCTGLSENWLPDGRMEVVANVKNRENRPVEVQINCVFKNEQGFPTGDESPFQTVVLSGNKTEAVRFTALNSAAKKYTIRVRQPR